MFKLIFEDEDLPLPVKQQLARLQIYIFITAVQEDDFLRRSSNPARRLLDGIISNEVEISKGDNPEFSGIQFIREHIDELASRQFITVDNYAEMLDEYKDYLQEHETSIRKARKLEATKKVLPLVKSRLSEIAQPLRAQGTSIILFEKVWLPLMVQIALRQGMDSDPWHKTIAMVKEAGLVTDPEIDDRRATGTESCPAQCSPFVTPRYAQSQTGRVPAAIAA